MLGGKSLKKFLLIFLIILLTACGRHGEIDEVEVTAAESSQVDVLIDTSIEEVSAYPQIIIPTENKIEFAYQSEGVFCIYTGGKYGFINEEGKEITSYEYDFAYPFNENLACVMKDKKYGFIDKYGNEKIPIIYDKANSFSEGLAYFEMGEKYGFINQNGEEIILLDCDSISSFKEGRAFFSIDGKYGFIDLNGQKVIDNIYDDVCFFENELAIVRKEGYLGVIDLSGNEVIPIRYDTVKIMEQYIEAVVDNIKNWFDFTGKNLLPSDCTLVNIDNNYIYFIKNEKYGSKKMDGNTVINPIYDTFRIIDESNLIIVSQEGKYGIIDQNGQVQVPLQYEDISIPYVRSSVIAHVNIHLNDKVGVLCLSQFEEIIPPTYDEVYAFYEGYSIVCLGDEYGLINDKGLIVIPLGEYDFIYSISDALICLKKNGIYYVAQNNGDIVYSKKCDGIRSLSRSSDCQIFVLNGSEGLLDKNGKVVLSARYDNISRPYDNVYGSNTSCITDGNYSSPKDIIIIYGESKDIDLSDIILTNEITPKIQPYHDLVLRYKKDTELLDSEVPLISTIANAIWTVKLFSIDGFEKPILYFRGAPIESRPFPLSNSFFYSIENNQAKMLVNANECGGSMRGNYAQLYLEKESGKIILGTKGLYGGFGGYASDYEFYNNENIYLYMSCISQDSRDFYWGGGEEFILENAHLFYDDDGNPLNKDNILEIEYMTQYSINKEIVSKEDFNRELEKYVAIPMELHF